MQEYQVRLFLYILLTEMLYLVLKDTVYLMGNASYQLLTASDTMHLELVNYAILGSI
jgi:hypothetical protein